MYEWYSKTWGEVVDELQSDERKGLSFEKVNERKKEKKKNSFSKDGREYKIRSKSLFKIFTGQILQLWSIMSILTCVLLLVARSNISFAIISILYIVTIYLVVSQNYKKEKDLKELEKLKPATSRVLRGGRILRIPAEQLVVGDIVYVEKGDIIPQDLRLIESAELKVNETAITGEINMAEKYETKIGEKELSLHQMTNILFRSSFVKDGSGTGIVIARENDTEIEKTMRMVYEDKKDKLIFKKNISKMINRYSMFSLAVVVIFLVYSLITNPHVDYIIRGLATILVASVPAEAMIMVLCFSSVVIKRLGVKGVFIKELWVLEVLSKIKVLCIDKIGTFTEENFIPETIFTDGKSIKMQAATLSSNENISRLLNVAILCNNLKTNIEINIIKICEESGMIKTNIERKQRRLLEIPYDSQRKIMTTINKYEKNYRANCSGDVDSILTRCTHIMKDGVEEYISQQDITKIKKNHIKLSINGKEAMAFAYRNFTYAPTLDGNVESNLVFVGIMSFENPILKNTPEAIEKLKLSDVKTVIITNENKLSAAYMQKKMQVTYGQDGVLAGVELTNTTEEEFVRIIEKVDILSKISSFQRTKIVKTYKDLGYTVGCTGSKLIHMPSLRTADIGIGIGKQCSSIIKKVGEVYLEGVGINSLIDTMNQGSNVISSMYKALRYVFYCCMASSLAIISMMIFSKEMVLSPERVLVSNVINGTFGAMAILYAYKENNKSKANKSKAGYLALGYLILGYPALNGVFGFVIGSKYDYYLGNSLAYILLSLNTIINTFYFNGGKFFRNIKSNSIVILNFLTQISIFIAFNSKYLYVIKWILLLLLAEISLIFLPWIIKIVIKIVKINIYKIKNYKRDKN